MVNTRDRWPRATVWRGWGILCVWQLKTVCVAVLTDCMPLALEALYHWAQLLCCSCLWGRQRAIFKEWRASLGRNQAGVWTCVCVCVSGQGEVGRWFLVSREQASDGRIPRNVVSNWRAKQLRLAINSEILLSSSLMACLAMIIWKHSEIINNVNKKMLYEAFTH